MCTAVHLVFASAPPTLASSSRLKRRRCATVFMLEGQGQRLREALWGEGEGEGERRRGGESDGDRPLGAGGPRIELAGVEYMNDDPAMVDVLYVPVRPGPGKAALERMCRVLVDAMRESQLLPQEEAEAQWLLDAEDRLTIKLHATLVNTVRRAAGTARPTFDARPLLRALSGRHVANVGIGAVHLSQMGPGRDADTGYYRAEHVLTFRLRFS